jgi:hypothetical protein
MMMIANESTTTVGREKVEVDQRVLIGKVLARYAAELTGACYTQLPSDFMKALQHGYEVDAFDSILQIPAELRRRPCRARTDPLRHAGSPRQVCATSAPTFTATFRVS